jgi:hypothetical protein
VYLTCQLVVSDGSQSAVDSLSDSLAIGAQPYDGSRTGTGLNSAALILGDWNRTARDQQSPASGIDALGGQTSYAIAFTVGDICDCRGCEIPGFSVRLHARA